MGSSLSLIIWSWQSLQFGLQLTRLNGFLAGLSFPLAGELGAFLLACQLVRLCRRWSLNWGLPRYLEDCATTDSTPACNSNPLQDIDQTTAAYVRALDCCSQKSHSQHSKRKLSYLYSPQSLAATSLPSRRSSTAYTPTFCHAPGASPTSDTTHTHVGHEEQVLVVANYGSGCRMHAAWLGVN